MTIFKDIMPTGDLSLNEFRKKILFANTYLRKFFCHLQYSAVHELEYLSVAIFSHLAMPKPLRGAWTLAQEFCLKPAFWQFRDLHACAFRILGSRFSYR